MTPSQAAYRAAEIIAERGHCKFNNQDADGRVCFIGALVVALCREEGRDTGIAWDQFGNQIMETAQVVLEARFLAGELAICTNPIFYNDSPAVTGEDVILLLKQTGQCLEEAGR